LTDISESSSVLMSNLGLWFLVGRVFPANITFSTRKGKMILERRSPSFFCHLFLTISVVCLIIFAAGCNDSSSVKKQPVSVSVSPPTAAIGTGQTMQFMAALVNDTAVTWTATAGTIDPAGMYTAPAGPESVTVSVTATSKADPTKSSSATVNVVAPGQV